jgi:hypothetical protein
LRLVFGFSNIFIALLLSRDISFLLLAMNLYLCEVIALRLSAVICGCIYSHYDSMSIISQEGCACVIMLQWSGYLFPIFFY